jgi:hypothetical protein
LSAPSAPAAGDALSRLAGHSSITLARAAASILSRAQLFVNDISGAGDGEETWVLQRAEARAYALTAEAERLAGRAQASVKAAQTALAVDLDSARQLANWAAEGCLPSLSLASMPEAGFGVASAAQAHAGARPVLMSLAAARGEPLCRRAFARELKRAASGAPQRATADAAGPEAAGPVAVSAAAGAESAGEVEDEDEEGAAVLGLARPCAGWVAVAAAGILQNRAAALATTAEAQRSAGELATCKVSVDAVAALVAGTDAVAPLWQWLTDVERAALKKESTSK